MKKLVSALLLLITALALFACSGGGSSGRDVGAPFAENVSWDWSAEKVAQEMGECAEPYASIYGGTTYAYPLQYLGRDGTIKFMFSENGKLASVAWTFITGSADELEAVRKEAEKYETGKNGDSRLTEGSGSSGSVWYTKDKDILLSSVAVSGSYGFQYSYISREFSKRDIAESE